LKSIDIGNFDINEYVKLFLDDNEINVSKDSINIDKLKNQFTIYHKGESFKFDDILEGRFSGRMIALGDSVSVLFNLDADILKNLVEGKHVFKIESDLVSNFTIDFELDETNMNLKLNPNNM